MTEARLLDLKFPLMFCKGITNATQKNIKTCSNLNNQQVGISHVAGTSKNKFQATRVHKRVKESGYGII